MSSSAWPPAGYPYPLIDGWLDGCIEERCWLPVEMIDGPDYAEQRAQGGREAAVRAMLASSVGYAVDALEEDGLELKLTDRVEHHRPLPEEAVEEGTPWEACAPDAPDAVAFYVVEVIDR